MKAIRIRDISGLYHEMFEPNVSSFQASKLEIIENCLDASSYFWSKFFCRERIQNIINIMKLNLHNEHFAKPQYLAVANDEEGFINRVINAPIKICAADIHPQDFFAELETLTILCQLYSDFEYAPLQLTIYDGFVLDADSSREVFDKCLNPMENPYLSFVLNEIMPLINTESPNVVFLHGRVSYYLMAIALCIKKTTPNTHICITRHATEYYSMSKICDLLTQNQFLFRMVDSVILEYFDYVESLLINVLTADKPLNEVPNLLFKEAEGKIISTVHQCPYDITEMKIDKIFGQAVIDVHLEPFSKCYWNQCTFCGINQKYRHEDHLSTAEVLRHKINQINALSTQCKNFWFIDEALSPNQLRNFANEILNSGVKIIWQARCRAEPSLLHDGLPKLLASAGLRELRIGLESASYFILKRMNKFDKNFSLELMEQIISTFQDCGISIHCPMIIGFPQEDKEMRQKTYEFLSQMSEKYSFFSFNINILNLDISSKLYKEWPKFHIQRLEFPCPPQHFLGNSIAWISENEQWTLNHERQQFMREKLYPWMPINSLLDPTIFYRLSETIRNTLLWKSNNLWTNTEYFSADMILQISPNLVVVWETGHRCLVYNWASHHYMHGNRYLIELLDCFKQPRSVLNVINSLAEQNPNIYHPEELSLLIQKMFFHKYLIGSVRWQDTGDISQLRETYNRIYENEDFIYKIESDNTLISNCTYLLTGNALELGVGMGKNISFLLSSGFNVTGVDLSDIAIKKMQQQYNNDRCKFIVGDIRDFYIQSENYSLIICSMVLSYLHDAELSLLAQKIMKGLIPNGCLFILDLSENDPLFHMPHSLTLDRRNFFTKEKILKNFNDLEIIELSDIYKKSPCRIGCNGYFGLVNYFGRKSKIK